MLTGGLDETKKRSGLAFLLDLDSESGAWQAQPSLRTPRTKHASTATDTAVYVFGGTGDDQEIINYFERLSLKEERDWYNRVIERQWT